MNTTVGSPDGTIKIARTAGFLYLLLAPLGFFGGMYIPSITVTGDAVTTVNNIMAHTLSYRLSILSALITPIVTVFVALYLYKLFKSVDRNQAGLMVGFAMAALPIAMLNQLNHFAVLRLLNNTDYLKVFSVDQIYSQVMFFLDLGHYGSFIAAIFWGLWLLPMGFLVIKSGFLPGIIGVLLIVAGFGYLIDSVGLFLLPNLNLDLSKFTFIGEFLMLLWLLIKGVNVEKWQKYALKSV
ncbi:MAG: DUF4386 domain-containing protein [Anaerolineaceae bacterium]|nr:DUF4386 domain-containing protein [Anaerolineaceae bacterium]